MQPSRHTVTDWLAGHVPQTTDGHAWMKPSRHTKTDRSAASTMDGMQLIMLTSHPCRSTPMVRSISCTCRHRLSASSLQLQCIAGQQPGLNHVRLCPPVLGCHGQRSEFDKPCSARRLALLHQLLHIPEARLSKPAHQTNICSIRDTLPMQRCTFTASSCAWHHTASSLYFMLSIKHDMSHLASMWWHS